MFAVAKGLMINFHKRMLVPMAVSEADLLDISGGATL
jgi:hypothetical protein